MKIQFDPEQPFHREAIAGIVYHFEMCPRSRSRDGPGADGGARHDGRGSYSIDQQRYNGQFGGNAFWEIRDGEVVGPAADVTYNAITTDFWANLDAVSGPEHWEMHGTGGDAKGQPTQTNSISHGSPWLLIRDIMVGAAYS